MNRWCLFTCLLVGVTGCTGYAHRAEISDQQSVDFAGVDRVEIDTRNGAVEVTCREGAGKLTLSSTRHARGLSEEEARRHAETIRVEAARDPARPALFKIAAHFPVETSGRSPGCDFRLEMPPGAGIFVRTANGKVVMEGVRGSVDANTKNGRIQLKDVVGSVRARTSNRAVRIEKARGDVDVETSNGEVVVADVEAGMISVATSNGRIEAEGVSGAASLETSNGSISLRAASLPRSPKVRAITRNGSVMVEVPSDVGARLSLETSNGSISRDFQGAAVSELESTRTRLNAVLNGGGGEIEARTSNGKVTFRTSAGGAGTKHL